MRLLLIHADFIEYETTERTKYAEGDGKRERVDDVLVAFTCVEKDDEKDPEIASRASEEIRDVASKLGVKRVMIYPYAHLSQSLASPPSALKILRQIEEGLNGMEVHRAPFGWYKSFSIRCKGHPLSELSRWIKVEESKALVSEKKAKSTFYILNEDGELIHPSNFNFSGMEKLRKFLEYEELRSRKVEMEPPHVRLMRRLEIADYEPGSDVGNLRYYPKGKLMKWLIEEYVRSEVLSYGAMEVETPVMYDVGHPALSSYLDRFPARQYCIESDKKDLFLRFAACFGQFLMGKDMTISYRNLPLRMFELTRYSYRREQSGELAGLRRLRAFTMPDMHTFCPDIESAKEEFIRQYELCIKVLEKIGISREDYEVGIRFTREFYEENREMIRRLARLTGKPMLAEVWDERFFYFVLKFEFNFIDALDKASALSTVQIDVENAERYGITYVDQSGDRRHPTILHCSPSGAIERCMYALLEKAWMKMKSGKLPMLPVWVSPVQVRVIPVSKEHLEYAEKVMNALNARVDIDDRDESVARKVRDASTEWIPYIAVVGDEEVKSNTVMVTIREESTEEKSVKRRMSVEELQRMIDEKCDGMPRASLPLPKKLSERPKFV